jgi:prepilin-type N-terminal cleavage/methylation domain-containing protein
MRSARQGITLLEVLVAIFIMGIGMLAILVLFPLGALNMARALKDDRCGSIAPNADSMAQGRGLRTDAVLVAGGTGDLSVAPAGYPPPDPNQPSYPVIVDPYFAQAGLTFVGSAPPGYANSPVRRVTPNYITASLVADPAAIDRWFSFQDDLTFETNGLPRNFSVAGGSLVRQGYYTWSYCFQRPKSGLPGGELMTVIVYQGRAIQTPTLEPSYQVSPAGNRSSYSLTLIWDPTTGQTMPDLRAGTWLMDSSFVSLGTGIGSAHAKFYRVTGAVQLSATSMQVEVFPPLRDANVQQVIVMEGAIEIFDRGSGR